MTYRMTAHATARTAVPFHIAVTASCAGTCVAKRKKSLGASLSSRPAIFVDVRYTMTKWLVVTIAGRFPFAPGATYVATGVTSQTNILGNYDYASMRKLSPQVNETMITQLITMVCIYLAATDTKPIRSPCCGGVDAAIELHVAAESPPGHGIVPCVIKHEQP